MSTTWRRAMLYLGLGPDEEYDDYDAQDDRGPAAIDAPTRGPAQMGSGVGVPVPVRPIHPVGYDDRPSGVSLAPAEHDDAAVSAIRTIPSESGSTGLTPKDSMGGSAVRPIPAVAKAKPHVVSPVSFTEAQDVADRFKGSQPVIINLQGADRDLSRRLIDFASGLCYGLGGQMERVADQVYLLTPTDVEVSDEERRRLRERGLHDT